MIKVGTKVRYAGDLHGKYPNLYPDRGTIGTVEHIDDDGDLWVKWQERSTSDDDVWCVKKEEVTEDA